MKLKIAMYYKKYPNYVQNNPDSLNIINLIYVRLSIFLFKFSFVLFIFVLRLYQI